MMQLIRNLKLWKKLIIVLACFSVPLFVLGRTMLSEIDKQIIDAQQELAGIAIVSPLTLMHGEIIQSASSLQSAAVRSTVQSAMSDFSTMAATTFSDSQTTIQTRYLEAALQTILTRGNNSGRADNSDDVTSLISDVADASQLSLDPALDSYYLVLVTTQYGPQLIQQLQAGLSSTKLYAPGAEGKLARLLADDRIARFSETVIPSSIQKAIEADPAYYETSPTLAPRTRAALDTFSKSLRELRGQLTETSNSVSAAQSKQSFRNAIDVTTALVSVSLEELSILVQQRIEFHEKLAKNAWIVCGLGLAILPGIAWLMIRSITLPVSDLIQISLRAAEHGDLTQQAKINSTDEIGTLGTAFNKMVSNLRGMVQQVQDSGRLVKGTSASISATAKQQQATASEIAATTLQIEATSKEISVTSAQLAATIKEVATVAEETTALASTGREGIVRMEETMVRITDACAAISDRLTVLSEKASKIGSVVTTINKVADQTNLLSLNAAIEAEKAGEVGRGFAVVATEIRRLADQTAISTGDIESMIKEIQSAVSAGVMGIERFADEVRRGVGEVKNVGGQLGEIISHVQGLPQHIDAVRDGMASQALGARQITDGLGQLSQAAQQTADSLRSSNECIDQLREASTMLESGIKRFVIEGDCHAVS